MMTEKQKAALAKRRKKREAVYNPSEGFCLPDWLSDIALYTQRYADISQQAKPRKAGTASWQRRQKVLCSLLSDIHSQIVQMHLTYPGSRAERTYKDLYTTIRGELAALQSMGSDSND